MLHVSLILKHARLQRYLLTIQSDGPTADHTSEGWSCHDTNMLDT